MTSPQLLSSFFKTFISLRVSPQEEESGIEIGEEPIEDKEFLSVDEKFKVVDHERE